MPALELIDVGKRFGEVAAINALSFGVERGAAVSLLGPSGCGKTTTLRVIAGFETPDSGSVLMSGVDIAGKRPYERNVGLLFQDYALFPHMSVAKNVAYGMRHRGVPAAEIPERTARMLSLVKLSGMEERSPGQLSGGQQQRVALARALATDPEVVLLDEPLSALDAKLRQELQMELKEILSSVQATVIVVTHDQEEAMSLTDDVIVMNAGRIAQRGTPSAIYARPTSRFVAEFVGRSNWFRGRVTGVEGGLYRISTEEGLELSAPEPEDGKPLEFDLCVRPERLQIEAPASGPKDAAANVNRLRGYIVDSVHLGPDTHTTVEIGDGRRLLVTRKSAGQEVFSRGAPVEVSFSARDCLLFAVPAP